MNRYEFQDWTTEAIMDEVVIALRKTGESAYRESNTLFTTASIVGIALAIGTSQVVKH